MKLNLKIKLIVFACCILFVSKAQTNFRYKSNTFSVAQTDFYRVLIDNSIRSKCKHENTFEGNWSWRVGCIDNATICNDCGECIKIHGWPLTGQVNTSLTTPTTG